MTSLTHNEFAERMAKALPDLLMGSKNSFKDSDQRKNFINLLSLHGLIPFYYNHYMSAHFHERDAFRQQVKKRYVNLSADILHKMAVQQELEQYLTQNHIAYMFMKGINLSIYLYHSTSMRPILDIDLLLRKEDLAQVRKFMLTQGGKETHGMQNQFMQGFAPHDAPITYKNVRVELHSELLSSNTSTSDNICDPWRNQHIYKQDSHIFNALRAHYYICYLCFHAYRHIKAEKIKLLWFVDIAMFLFKDCQHEEQLIKLLKLSSQLHVRDEVENVLHIISNVMLKNDQLFPETPNVKNHALLENEFLRLLKNNRIETNVNVYVVQWRSLKGMDKIQYILSVLFPQVKYIKTRFGISNPFIALLILILNPIRIVSKVFMYLAFHRYRNKSTVKKSKTGTK